MLEKLRPDFDLLCYFYRPSAIAALSNASASGFTVSGTWRQQFDWCVVDWVRDNTFEHPSFRNLPDGDLSGLTLTYDETRSNCIALDSSLYATVDWPSLRIWANVANVDTLFYVNLKQYATPIAGSYQCASATVQLGGTITGGDYIGISFLGEHYTYQLYGTDTVTSAAQAIVDSINAFSPGMIASRSGGSITVTYVGQDSSGTKLTASTSTTGANGNRLGLYTYTTGSTETWDVGSKQFSGGTSPTTWRFTIPFGSLTDRTGATVPTTDVRKMRWTYAADLQPGSYQRSEFSVQVANWTVTGTNRAYQVAGFGSRRFEDDDPAAVYSGSWSQSKGNFSGGTINLTTTPGSSVSYTYTAATAHTLYIGTRVAASGGSIQLQVDGASAGSFNLALTGEDVLVRKKVGQYAAGTHTVTATHNGASGTAFYFDFFELAQPTSQLPQYPVEPKITAATDWDTDHSLALAPERTAGMLNSLGLHGRHNLYVGALEFYELYSKGNAYASQTVTFTGTPSPSSIVSLSLQRLTDPPTVVQHLIHAGDTPATIAKAFEQELNRGYTGVWASSSGPQLTIHARSLGTEGNNLQVTGTPSSGFFYVQIPSSQFTGGADGVWTTDLTAVPRINRACRDWMGAFFAALKNLGIDGVAAFSTELGDGDQSSTAGIAQRYPDGTPVVVSTPALQTNFSPASIAYWQQVYLDCAIVQANAGMQPYLQFGEVQWWYFPKAGVGMTFYDNYTKAQFLAAYGQPISVIPADTTNPASYPNEAAFLPTLIGAYTTAIMNFVRASYPNARFEVLYPTDVNEGAFNQVINYPTASWTSSTLTCLKTESFTYTLDRNLQKAESRSLQTFGFPRAQRAHLVGVSDPTTAWLREARTAETMTSDSVVLFALDQFCLVGFPMPLARGKRGAAFNR